MTGPVVQSDRIGSLDVLRGFALLGILVMNIQAFSMPDAAYSNPTVLEFPGFANHVIWFLGLVFFDMKFMTVFSILFGAGILLFTSTKEARGESPRRWHYRRMIWLLVLGLFHGYIIWWGDILVWYALSGLWVYPMRRMSARKLVVIGMILVTIGGLIALGVGLSLPYWPEESREEFISSSWSPSQEKLDEQIETFRGGYIDQLKHRAAGVTAMNTFLYLMFGAWRAGGAMLLGMGLFKLGVLSGTRSRRFYAWMVAIGFGVGLPVVIYGIHQNIAHEWSSDYSTLLGVQYNYFASILVAGGLIGAVVLVFLSGRMFGLTSALAAVGRMAFTNYIMHSLICTTIFYGYGLGLFAGVDRVGQLAVVLAVWALQLVLSPWWLKRFRFGPLEWLWRSLTYGSRQPFRVAR